VKDAMSFELQISKLGNKRSICLREPVSFHLQNSRRQLSLRIQSGRLCHLICGKFATKNTVKQSGAATEKNRATARPEIPLFMPNKPVTNERGTNNNARFVSLVTFAASRSDLRLSTI
jgi:hypothetical protein